jgi:chemotaxis protein CheZ
MSKDEKPAYMTEEYVNRLNDLTSALKAGNDDEANQLIAELTTLRESSLFQQLGKLTRDIHESINSFGSDERIVELTQDEIPDAKERLNFIVTKTDEAAHRTMTNAEQAMDIVEEFNKKGTLVHQSWNEFRTSKLSKAEFLALSEELDQFLSSIDGESDKVKAKMTDIMMAQDYQDITGQMIKQVITMVKEIEEKLVHLVAISGPVLTEIKTKHEDGAKAHGPQLPTADKTEVATSQNEVDDLLASLGF